MTNLFTQSLAICAAAFLTIASIGAIVTVPPAHAGTAILSTQLA